MHRSEFLQNCTGTGTIILELPGVELAMPGSWCFALCGEPSKIEGGTPVKKCSGSAVPQEDTVQSPGKMNSVCLCSVIIFLGESHNK